MFPVHKLKRENTQPKNMCDIVFAKVKGRGGTVNITSDYAEAPIQMELWEISQNSQESTYAGVFF